MELKIYYPTGLIAFVKNNPYRLDIVEPLEDPGLLLSGSFGIQSVSELNIGDRGTIDTLITLGAAGANHSVAFLVDQWPNPTRYIGIALDTQNRPFAYMSVNGLGTVLGQGSPTGPALTAGTQHRVRIAYNLRAPIQEDRTAYFQVNGLTQSNWATEPGVASGLFRPQFLVVGAQTLQNYSEFNGSISWIQVCDNAVSMATTSGEPTVSTPTVLTFGLDASYPVSSVPTSIAITTPITGTDANGITDWWIGTSATIPALDDPGWVGSATPPTTITATSLGAQTWYVRAVNADGNISDALSSTTTLRTSYVEFTTTGATFNPTIEISGGNTATWTCTETAQVLTGVDPTFDFGTVAVRHVRLTVATSGGLAAITTLNLGFDNFNDSGRYQLGAAYNKSPQACSGVTNLTNLTGLVNFAAANGNLTGALDFTGCSNLRYVECYAAQVESVNLTGCTSLWRICFEANRLTSLDLNPVAGNLRDLRAAVQQAGPLTFVTLTSNMTALYHFCTRDQTVINVPPGSRLPAVEELWIWNCNQSGAYVAGAGLVDLQAYQNHYTSFDFTAATLVNNVLLANSNLSSAEVNRVLRQLAAHSVNNGTVNLAGNSGPTEQGTAAASVLTGRGWTVTTATAVADTEAPTMSAFTTPASSPGADITFTIAPLATDNIEVTGYAVTVNTAVVPELGTFTSPSPTGITVSGAGSFTLRAYARDYAGNISSALSGTTIVNDVTLPVITAFVLPAESGGTITITTLTATDNVAVTGYAITEDTTDVPLLSAFGALPSTITAGSLGAHTYRAYARDATGNISAAASQTCTVVTSQGPTITAFGIPTASNTLSGISISTFTTTNDPTEYAVVVQPAADAAPATPTTGWSGTIPTTVTAPGAADGYFTAYIWCRNNGGTSAYATANVLVIQTNAALTLGAVLSPSSFRVTFTYDFATAGQVNDWTPMGVTNPTLAVTGGNLNVTGGTGELIGMHWAGMTSRTYANNRIQLETATASTSVGSSNTLGNLIYGHGDVYTGQPFNPNPGYMLTKRLFQTNSEFQINGTGFEGGTLWTPVINTFYDITYTISAAALTMAIDGHGSFSVTAGGYTLANSAQHVSFGPYSSTSSWSAISLTGIVSA